jgi:hypothetical protein
MAFEAERQAANVVAPEQSATAGEGVTILAATTSAASAALPAALFNRYIYLQAVGDDIWVNFDSDAVTDISKAGAGASTFAAGTVAANAMLIKNGERFAVRPSKARHAYIKWQANATSSKLLVWPTTQKGRL